MNMELLVLVKKLVMMIVKVNVDVNIATMHIKIIYQDQVIGK